MSTFQLFNYTTLSTRLEKSTRTLFVTLNRPDHHNCIGQEMLFELESLLAWVTTRVEIHSVFIDSCTTRFSAGIDQKFLPMMKADKLEKMNQKLQKIIFAMMQLPQTVIVDLGEGAANLACELALGADIRLCSVNADIRFDHGKLGLVPAAGGMGFLSQIVAPAFARQWVLQGNTIAMEALVGSGFIARSYDSTERSDVVATLLYSIAEQAPIQRIQAKLGLFESIRVPLENAMASDRKIARASLVSEDWKQHTPDSKSEDFMPAKSMSYAVKLSLIKNDELARRDGIETEH